MKNFINKYTISITLLALITLFITKHYQSSQVSQRTTTFSGKVSPLNYTNSTLLNTFNKKNIDEYQTAAGTYDIQTIASEVTSTMLTAFSNNSERTLPLVANWNVGIPEYSDGLDPLYVINRFTYGEHLVPTWKLDPYYNDNIGLSYYETSIKKAAALGLPLVFILPSPESALTKDDIYFSMDKTQNPNVITVNGTVLPELSPFGPDALWSEVGEQWSTTTLMAQLQEWYPNPPLVIFIDEDASKKLSWSKLATSSRYIEHYPTNTSNEFKRTLVNAKWLEKYRQLHEGIKQGFIQKAWKQNVKFVTRNQLAVNMGATSDWRNSATTTNQYANIWPLIADGLTINFNLDGDKTDTTDAPHRLLNNLPFMIEEAKELNPNFTYQLSIDANQKIDDPQRYRGFTQFALWFLRPSIIRQTPNKTMKDEINPLFQEIVDSVELIHDSDVLTDFWKNGKLVSTGNSNYTQNIPTNYQNVPREFLLNTDTTSPVWAFALEKSITSDREWLIYVQSPEANLTDVTLSLPNYGNILINTTQRGDFYIVNNKDKKQISIDLNNSNILQTDTNHTTINLIKNSIFLNMDNWQFSSNYSENFFDKTVSATADSSGSIKFTHIGDRLYSQLIPVKQGLIKIGFKMKSDDDILNNISLQIGLYDKEKHFIKNDIHGTMISNSTKGIWENSNILVNIPDKVYYIQIKISLFQYMETEQSTHIHIDDIYVFQHPEIEIIPERKKFEGVYTQIDKYGNIQTVQNGKLQPYFPLCIYNDKHRDLNIYSKQGFNCVAWASWYGAIEEAKNAISTFNPEGMKVAFDISSYMNPSRKNYRNFDNLKKNIDKIYELNLQNNLLWYYWDNEHIYSSWHDPIDVIDVINKKNITINGKSNHPIYSLNGNIGIARKYNNLINITGTYIVWDNESFSDDTNSFLTMTRINDLSSPVVVAQINLGLDANKGIGDRMRAVVYKAIIQGAKAIGYWKDKPKQYYPENEAYGDITSQKWWNDFPNIRHEIDILLQNGIIQAPPVINWKAITNNQHIKLGIKEINNTKYLILANMNNLDINTTITIQNVSVNGKSVTDLFSNKKILSTIHNNSFDIIIQAYGSKVIFIK